MIYNGNRTKWSPIRSVIIQVINKIRQLVNHENYNRQNWKTKIMLPINHNLHNFQKQQIHIGQISVVETNSKLKNGYCDQFYDW